MKYKYLVTCWVYPKSGFDLKKRYEAEEALGTLGTLFNPKKRPDLIEHIREDHPGMVIKEFMVETDHEVINGQEYLLPYILSENPGAELLNWESV